MPEDCLPHSKIISAITVTYHLNIFKNWPLPTDYLWRENKSLLWLHIQFLLCNWLKERAINKYSQSFLQDKHSFRVCLPGVMWEVECHGMLAEPSAIIWPSGFYSIGSSVGLRIPSNQMSLWVAFLAVDFSKKYPLEKQKSVYFLQFAL